MGQSSAISAIILAALSIYCLWQYYQANGLSSSFATVTFVVSGLYGTLVALDEANNFGRDLRTHIDLLEDTLVVPFLATEIWLKVGRIPQEAAWFHAVVAFIPVLLYYINNKSIDNDFQDGLQYLAVGSLICAGVLSNNYYTIGAGASYGLGRFSFRRGRNCMDFNCIDMYNYALCGFVSCALIALNGSFM